MVVKEVLVTIKSERIVEAYALMKYPEVKSIKSIPKIPSFNFENLRVLFDESNIRICPLSLIFSSPTKQTNFEAVQRRARFPGQAVPFRPYPSSCIVAAMKAAVPLAFMFS